MGKFLFNTVFDNISTTSENTLNLRKMKKGRIFSNYSESFIYTKSFLYAVPSFSLNLAMTT